VRAAPTEEQRAGPLILFPGRWSRAIPEARERPWRRRLWRTRRVSVCRGRRPWSCRIRPVS